MAGGAEFESEFDRGPDVEADPSVEAEDEDLVAHPKDLEDDAGYTEIWSHLSKSHEE